MHPTAPIRIYAALMSLLLASVGLAGAAVIRVSASGPANGTGDSWSNSCPTIATAMGRAIAGDEIWVASGIYREDIVLKSGVALLGGFSGTETVRSERNWKVNPTRLVGNGAYWQDWRTRWDPIIRIAADADSQTRLDGFVVQEGDWENGGGVHIAGGTPILANNVFWRNNSSGRLGGAAVFVDRSFRVEPATPLELFESAARELLADLDPALSLTNIALYPTNAYSDEVQRRLQLAANLADATRVAPDEGVRFPLVFQPLIRREGTNLSVAGFSEVTHVSQQPQRRVELTVGATNTALFGSTPSSAYGLFEAPMILSASEDWPVFSEANWLASYFFNRRLRVTKLQPRGPVVQTNASHMVSMTNQFGLEILNPSTNAITRSFYVTGVVVSAMSATLNGQILARSAAGAGRTGFVWRTNRLDGNRFVLPLLIRTTEIPHSILVSHLNQLLPVSFATSNAFYGIHTNASPDLRMTSLSSLDMAVVDEASGRIVEQISLGPIRISLSTADFPSFGSSTIPGYGVSFWGTNGVQEQIGVSLDGGSILPAPYRWPDAYSFPSARERAINDLRVFMGLRPTGVFPTNPSVALSISWDVPFVLEERVALRAVRETIDPLLRRAGPAIDLGFGNIRSRSYPGQLAENLTNSSTSWSSLGKINAYAIRPWLPVRREWFPGPPGERSYRQRPRLDFPASPDLNTDWLNRIHRGSIGETVRLDREAAGQGDLPLLARLRSTRFGWRTTALPSAPILVNNTFLDSTGPNDGAVRLVEGTGPILVNNLFTRNAGGVFAEASGAAFANNLFSGNSGFNVAGSVATNVAEADPFLFKPNAGDARPQGNSPLIDAGSIFPFLFGWLLPDGGRGAHGGIDIGAIEAEPNDPPLLHPSDVSGLGDSAVKATAWPGSQLVLEESNDLVTWSRVSTNTASAGLIQWIVPQASASTNRFFRVRIAR